MNNVNKLQIGEYEINQPFYRDTHGIIGGQNMKFFFNTNNFRTDELTFIEYVIIIINTEENLENTTMLIQQNGRDLASRRHHIYYNKIYPLEYETAYDNETNLLLTHMVRTNIPNVLFMPLDIVMGGNLQICVFNILQSANIEFYFKLNNGPREKNLDINNGLYTTELIEQLFSNSIFYGKTTWTEISRNGDLITNIYLKLIQNPNKKHIKDFYKLYDRITIHYGEHIISTIPIDYIILYLKYIKNICISDICVTKCHIIPINLKELINVPSIAFSNTHWLKMCLHPNNISKFYHDTKRNINCNNIDLTYINSDINLITADIWDYIFKYLTMYEIVHTTEICKFFYSFMSQQKIDKLYDTCRITVDDLDVWDGIIDVMYHKYQNDPNADIPELCDKSLANLTQFNSKSIIQHEIIISGEEYLFEIERLYPIAYLIIEFDVAGQYDILDMEKTKHIDGVITDIDFFSRMHNPQSNRYVLYIDPHTDNINFVFKKYVYSKVNIYIVYEVDTIIES